ncbi:Myb/SANT-like DNA-binding domain protein [Senna tora]|uniref:Myb/SANT-like DNA-binding domain protein n=1 Tax=Senna tora TaxID=362788 RepID=A0A834XA58_9FABA|nr:Myb/SANT-like DNA-binding domain protein [Senna tora]
MSEKSMTSEKSKGSSGRETWSPEMDEALVDAFFHQHNMGNKNNGNFTTTTYDNITKELEAKFDRVFEKEKVKTRWKNLKSRFAKCYDLFKHGLSGFSWNPTTKYWCAKPEVWEKLIETKPEAQEWMRKPIAHYDKMMVIYGNDRATGQISTTAKEKRKRPLIEETESLDTIDASSEMGNQDLGDDNAVTSPAVQIVQDLGENSSKKNKKTNKCDQETERVGKALEDIAQAIKDGNTIFEKVMQKNPISEAEVWKLLKDLNIDADLIGSVYLHLVENPDKLRALIGLPDENRKAFLLQIVFGSSNPPRYILLFSSIYVDMLNAFNLCLAGTEDYEIGTEDQGMDQGMRDDK